MLRATKVRIYPTGQQTVFLNAQFGAIRFVYNRALDIKKHWYTHHQRSLSVKNDLKPLLAVAKKSGKYNWLSQYDAIALQQACINLDRAFQNFFDKKFAARYPRVKRKRGKQSSYHCTSVSFGDNWIKVPKCQPVKARIHRAIEGKLRSITLSRSATGKYYASLLVEDGLKTPSPITTVDENKVIGLDLGLTHLIVDSNFQKIDNPGFIKQSLGNLRRKQKKLSRKQKGSQGRARARLLVAKCHERTANARNHFQHILSKQLVDENQAIVVESLKVRNMLKNRRLSKHIADASWHSLGLKIGYKAKAQGKHKIEIDGFFPSSKIHNACGHKVESMPLSVRNWDCPCCGKKGIDRDQNAALNIKEQGILKLKAAGLTVSANGGLRKSVLATVAA